MNGPAKNSSVSHSTLDRYSDRVGTRDHDQHPSPAAPLKRRLDVQHRMGDSPRTPAPARLTSSPRSPGMASPIERHDIGNSIGFDRDRAEQAGQHSDEAISAQ